MTKKGEAQIHIEAIEEHLMKAERYMDRLKTEKQDLFPTTTWQSLELSSARSKVQEALVDLNQAILKFEGD